MVTTPALRELRPAIAEFAISATVSALFTVLMSVSVGGEELPDGFRRAERVSGGPDDRFGQVLRPARPGVPAIVDLVEHHGHAGRARRGREPVHDRSVSGARQRFRGGCALTPIG